MPARCVRRTGTPRPTRSPRHIALVAHDHKKQDLLEWARFNRPLLAEHELHATAATGRLLREALGLPVASLQSGPLGGDQQIGARIAEGRIDLLVFFWDPLQPQPHDPDVKALLRIAVVWNVPVACNRATADFLVSSPLMTSAYRRRLPDHTGPADAACRAAAAGTPAPVALLEVDPPRSLTGESSPPEKAGRSPARARARAGGKSGLRRAGCWLTARGGDPTDSATESRPPRAPAHGKGETVR
jgi:methylglyoxal synthase